ncbi:MAG: glycosyltransferase family 39 protein [Candidatus Obscuribacterales bacterium]|nr:glycosyltransferase family 39 protein [Candidatus Obscuribacterales bacterium]
MNAGSSNLLPTVADAPSLNKSKSRKTIFDKPAFAVLFIFALSFILRYLYNAVFMEHRIAHFGDAYNFLRTGSAILEAAASSQNPLDFIWKIYNAAPPEAQLLQSMTSMKLTDRLMIDGPVFPAYLALVEWLSGVDPFKPIFDAHSVHICLCNSFIDALATVLVYQCGRLAFNRRIALVAGIIFALYPPAIINTQHCYSEPFSYFLLNIWTALTLQAMLRHSPRGKALTWCGIGLSAGLLMLSKPAFILLAPMLAALLTPISLLRTIKTSNNEGRAKSLAGLAARLAKQGLLAGLGAAIALGPWVIFNKQATGQYSVFVNRVPSFNIFHGNQISTDAWRCYPFYGTFPGDSKLVIASLLSDAQKQPLVFIGLQFKKLARLWSGVWNEYHYSLFGLPIEVQSLLHQILLLSGAIGLSYLLFRSRHKLLSRQFTAAIIFGSIVLFHFAYIPFEAISRYAITAMPAVVLLSAALFYEAFRQSQSRRALLRLLVFAAFALPLVSASGSIANFLAGILPQSMLSFAPILACGLDWTLFALLILLSAGIYKALESQEPSRKLMLALPITFAVLSCLVAAFYTIQSFDWREWTCPLKAGQTVVQTISVSKKPDWRGSAFVLMDLSSQIQAPPVEIRLNGKTLTETAIPLAQLQNNNNDILQCLAIQAEGMSRDLRGFRNWWVIPFPASEIQEGQNKIEISSKLDKACAVIYGDYLKTDQALENDGEQYLPSLHAFSYTKGFTTFDHRDPRVFEKTELAAKSSTKEEDLSELPGRQYGRYRLRLLIPQSTEKAPEVKELKKQQESVIVSEEPLTVRGSDPSSFLTAKKSYPLEPDLIKGTRFQFSCQLRKLSGNGKCFVSLQFSGKDKSGQNQSWTSKWQPIGIELKNDFQTTSFSDRIPDQILELSGLQVEPMFSPFQPDYLFLKKKQALKNAMEVRDARFSLLAPLSLPAKADGEWQVY